MKSRKRKPPRRIEDESIPNKKCIIESSITDINYYGNLVKPDKQRCEFCETEFKNRYDILIHTARHIIIPLIKQTVHICKVCSFCFTSQIDLDNHMKNKHHEQKLSDIIEKVVRTQLQIKCENLNLNIDKPSTDTTKELITVSDKVQHKVNVVDEINNKIKKLLHGNKSEKVVNKQQKAVKLDLRDAPLKPITELKVTPQKPTTVLKGPPQKSVTEDTNQQILQLTLKSSSKVPPVQETTLDKPFLTYIFPPNNVTSNSLFQTPSFAPGFGLQQPAFITMLTGSPMKPAEEEFILPDLPAPIIPSHPLVDRNVTSKPSHSKSVLNPAEVQHSKNNCNIIPGPSLSNLMVPVENTASLDTLTLLEKSPLLMKQLLMKSPEMTNSFSIKNRIVFEDEMCDEDDDVICITDQELKKNPPKNSVNNPPKKPENRHVPVQLNGTSRFITIENGQVTQEFRTNNSLPPLPPLVRMGFENNENTSVTIPAKKPMTNSIPMEFTESVSYGKLMQPGMFRCKQCPKIFPNRFDAIVHEAKHISFRRHINGHLCSGCDYFISWASIPDHRRTCLAKPLQPSAVCRKCHLKYYDIVRHNMIYHAIFKCACSAKFKSQEDLRNHVQSATCTAFKITRLCEVCLLFVTRQGTMKFEIISVVKKYGKKFQCSECGSMVDEVTILRIFRKLFKKLDVDKKTKPPLDSNEKRLKSIQKRLKHITKMGKF